jgi:hypothetical protein
MGAVRCRIFEIALMLAVVAAPSMLPAPAHAYTQEEEQACSGDAMRLCGSEIPDVDRITACMFKQRAALSPGCRIHFRSSAPERGSAVTRAAADRPLNIRHSRQREAGESQSIR